MKPGALASLETAARTASSQYAKSVFRITAILVVCNLLSAVLFISFVNRPAYDDAFNIYDVHQYATKGVSVATVRAQRNAPGPTSFIWMAGAVRLLGGDELRAARIGALLSWVLLAAGILWGARFSRSPELWYAALVTLLVFPHAVEAACTLLTEGPALFFALLGALGWVAFVERGGWRISSLLCGMAASLFLGISVTCRQYNLALLPAAGLVALAELPRRAWDKRDRFRWVASSFGSLCFSLVPILLLVLAWKGIANPSIESGAAYNGMYKAAAGLNPLRPLIALFCTSFYLLWLTFPLMFRVRPPRRWLLGLAILAGMAAGHWHESLLQPGPINTVVNLAARMLHGPALPLGIIAALAAYNLMALLLTLWDAKDRLLGSPAILFSVLAIVFFVGEQFAVGGNIPFYDRYVLQIAPFLGVIAFAVLPSLNRMRLMALIALSFFSHVVVWRNAFGH